MEPFINPVPNDLLTIFEKWLAKNPHLVGATLLTGDKDASILLLSKANFEQEMEFRLYDLFYLFLESFGFDKRFRAGDYDDITTSIKSGEVTFTVE